MDYEKPTERPAIGVFHCFDHLTFWVGNAKAMAAHYNARFGFTYLAYSGLETGSKKVASHVVKNDRIVIQFQSSLDPNDSEGIGAHVMKRGDGVRDVAFSVDDAAGIYKKAVERGAKSVREPETLSDEHGQVVVASILAYNETIHTFVQRAGYKGPFMPGYQPHYMEETINKYLPPVNINFIDHVVCNQPIDEMEPTAEWYEKMLDFHRFWSVDETIMHTDYSALKSTVMADFDENVKLPINEPAIGKKKSQIQEYVDYYAGSGVQHIALNTKDIIGTITALRERGVEFLEVPKAYYDNLRKNIPNMTIEITEDIDAIEKLRILVDYDDKGYLLQLFTKPIEDRPTLFYEFIQRHNHQGFGVGNFKSLFKAIEDDQAKRGNLD
jgi:4-hydroxyphenylpyruvate dioxygenase